MHGCPGPNSRHFPEPDLRQRNRILGPRFRAAIHLYLPGNPPRTLGFLPDNPDARQNDPAVQGKNALYLFGSGSTSIRAYGGKRCGTMPAHIRVTYNGARQPFEYTIDLQVLVVPRPAHATFDQWKSLCRKRVVREVSASKFDLDLFADRNSEQIAGATWTRLHDLERTVAAAAQPERTSTQGQVSDSRPSSRTIAPAEQASGKTPDAAKPTKKHPGHPLPDRRQPFRIAGNPHPDRTERNPACTPRRPGRLRQRSRTIPLNGAGASSGHGTGSCAIRTEGRGASGS